MRSNLGLSVLAKDVKKKGGKGTKSKKGEKNRRRLNCFSHQGKPQDQKGVGGKKGGLKKFMKNNCTNVGIGTKIDVGDNRSVFSIVTGITEERVGSERRGNAKRRKVGGRQPSHRETLGHTRERARGKLEPI